MKQLLNEDIIRMQNLAGINTKETFETVLQDFLLEIDLHQKALNEGQILNEGLWEKAKYYLSKLGRYKVNGEFGIGKRKQLDKLVHFLLLSYIKFFKPVVLLDSYFNYKDKVKIFLLSKGKIIFFNSEYFFNQNNNEIILLHPKRKE